MTSPWGKPRQIPPGNMKDIKIFQKTIEEATSAKAVAVASDKAFARECSAASHNDTQTCIVVMKGARYNGKSAVTEENLIKVIVDIYDYVFVFLLFFIVTHSNSQK